LTAPGEVGTDFNLNVYTFAEATASVPLGPMAGEELVETESGLRGQPIVPVVALFAPAINTEVGLQFGLLKGLELGTVLGLQHFGTEFRTGMTLKSFSLAASAGVFYRPLADPSTVWLRAGIDMSVDLGSITPLVNAYLSNGPETHLLDEELFGDETCQEDDFVNCSVTLTRRETRLTGAIGVGIRPAGRDMKIIVGVVPHVTLWADDRHDVACNDCDEGTTPQITSLTEDWGMTFTLGISR